MKPLYVFSLFVVSVSVLTAQTLYVPSGTSGIGNNSTNGNVGVGVAVPGYRLEVSGGGRNDSLGVKGPQPGLQLENTATGGHTWNLWAVGPAETVQTGGLTLFDATAGAYRLAVDTSGNVGIGTTNPTQKLSVNGTIRAKEVIVDTGWSDYVFADDYRLAPLSEIETQIKAERHLPGIPSAQEVADHGVSMGEIQAKLLAKIEELTLRAIAQEKVTQAQSRQIEAIASENQQLKAQLSQLLRQ